jgi:hypothetical protein
VLKKHDASMSRNILLAQCLTELRMGAAKQTHHFSGVKLDAAPTSPKRKSTGKIGLLLPEPQPSDMVPHQYFHPEDGAACHAVKWLSNTHCKKIVLQFGTKSSI